MKKKLIYIADDQVNICNIIATFLEKEGYQVRSFYDGRSVYEAFMTQPADLLILDIMMPDMDGYAICSLVRSQSSVPIIFVSAKDTEFDKITGLTLGSDDYLTKPFSPTELVARVKSIFRRIELDKQENISPKIVFSDLVLCPNTRQATINQKDIGLTQMEFDVLYYLALNRHKAVSRNELLDKVWGFSNEVNTRATDDMIKRIRRKLAEANSNVLINTVWGYGFIIKDRAKSHDKNN